ncbi:vomeronasal type-2 receptor 26-like [Papio anubis]|uniref:vomeronasal type-2 receptor 26-like n=1 Tax=Papio anubis TaxID=9555 RepID=UPI0012AD56DE|nr:vomeronasal type-2 receptor 26-like [Papio anubis]XP_031515168.1 vomeronasal type-2 receptor 26-like [Papio anubis]
MHSLVLLCPLCSDPCGACVAPKHSHGQDQQPDSELPPRCLPHALLSLFLALHQPPQPCHLPPLTDHLCSYVHSGCVFCRAFQATRPASRIRKWMGPQKTHSVVFLCSCIQGTLCGIWLGTEPPFVDNDPQSVPGYIIIQCNEGSVTAFHSVLGYLGFLVLGTLAVVFLARNLPDAFNEAKFLTFSMLVSCGVWVSFLPSYYSTQGKARVAVRSSPSWAPALGYLAASLLPSAM